MVALQKQALFNAVVCLAALSLFAVLVPLLGPEKAQAAFAVLALTGLGRIFYRTKTKEPVTDERDRAINERAIKAALVVFWVIFIPGNIAGYFVRSSEGTIPAYLLVFIALASWAVFLLAHSVAMLVLYSSSSALPHEA